MPEQTLRIISGQWRRRKLHFVEAEGLRPTSDRVRETAFNWLAQPVLGARCLDLFAGSGALGFEAASRGAKEVVMFEQSRAAVQQLRHNVSLLAADQIHVYQGDALKLLTQQAQPFDIIFCDPPFYHDWLNTIIPVLLEHQLLMSTSYLYVEVEKKIDLIPKQGEWIVLKQSTAGSVKFGLLKLLGYENNS